MRSYFEQKAKTSMSKILIFNLIIFYSSACAATPSLPETLHFMSNITSNYRFNTSYTTTIDGNGCNIKYTNHPEFNSSKVDKNIVSESCTTNATPWTDAGKGDSSTVKNKLNIATERAKDFVGNAAYELTDGFFNYFSDEKKNKDILESRNRKLIMFHQNIFLLQTNLSKLNPTSIEETENGFIVQTTNNEKFVKVSFYKEECVVKDNTNTSFLSSTEGIMNLIKKKEVDLGGIFFYVETAYKQKFKKALEYSIKKCGGKKDLF